MDPDALTPVPDEIVPDGTVPDGTVPDGTVSWRQLLAEAEQRLAESEVPDARISARRIVEEVSGLEGAELAAGLRERATHRAVVRFDRMVDRRCSGEPLQYVIGHWGFRHLDLMVDRRVLIPRPETETVAERALVELRRLGAAYDDPIAVDIGAGSGAIGLSLAFEHHRSEVWLSDVDSDALDVARANLAGLGRHGSRVRIVHGSWFDALPVDLAGRIAVVVSNPPYVARHEVLPTEVSAWEPAVALFGDDDGFAPYDVLIGESLRWLCPGGALVVECASWQVEVLCERARASFVDVESFADLAGRARGLVARAPVAPSPGA